MCKPVRLHEIERQRRQGGGGSNRSPYLVILAKGAAYVKVQPSSVWHLVREVDHQLGVDHAPISVPFSPLME